MHTTKKNQSTWQVLNTSALVEWSLSKGQKETNLAAIMTGLINSSYSLLAYIWRSMSSSLQPVINATRRCDRDSWLFATAEKPEVRHRSLTGGEVYVPISKVPIFSSPLFSWFDRTNDEITTGCRSRRWHNARSSKLSTNGRGKLLACIDVDLFPFDGKRKMPCHLLT